MNERIRELALIAGYYINFDANGTLVYTSTPGTGGDLDLFAKLILAEVDNIVTKVYQTYPLHQAVVCLDIDYMIKEHFYETKNETTI